MKDEWADHKQRLEFTEMVIQKFADLTPIRSAADLSCGDAHFASLHPQWVWQLGDYGPGYDYTGPIEETIESVADVDLFVCCETIEHLDDPDAVLRRIRAKSKHLVLSTPKKYETDINPEHYWSWDDYAVKEMLFEAGWEPHIYRETGVQPGYIFQIWGCS